MPATRARERGDLIDQVLGLDPGGRAIPALAAPGAAAAAARALQRARRVLIVTGFSLPPGLPETDGPPGAAVIGRGLRALGAEVQYVTDRANIPVLGAVLETLGEPTEIRVFPDGDGAARAVLSATRPTHLVAIERVGRNRDGDYLDMRGRSIAAWNAPLDALFLDGGARARRRPRTIGIGDGGNEIGMGAARGRLARLGPLAARIVSVVRADHLVLAGVSNWGGYGVVAALARLTGRDLLHTADVERKMIAACVEAGAIDGVTRRREPTVDGLPLEMHASVVELLRWAARSGIIPA